MDSIHTLTHTQTQVHEHRHTHSHMHTCRQENTPMHPHTHVPLVTSELTISSSWSQPLQCCPSALAWPPHSSPPIDTATTYNSTSDTDVHNGTQTVLATLHYNVTHAVNKHLLMISHTRTYITCTCTHSLKCTGSRGAIAATHCHGLYRQIPHALHCPSPACFPKLHSLFPPSLRHLSSLLQDRCPLMISIQSSSQDPYSCLHVFL